MPQTGSSLLKRSSRNATLPAVMKSLLLIMIASRLLATALVLALLGCDNGTPAAGKTTSSSGKHSVVHASRNDDRAAGSHDLLADYKVSYHFRARMQERDVSAETVVDVIENGRRFYDPKNDSNIRWKDGVYVAIAPDGTLKTVVRGRIENRWRPQSSE
jgi:hypothetical protein